MADNTNTEDEVLECEMIHIILPVPKDTVTVSVTAKMILDGELEEATMDMTPDDFRQARQDFLDNVEEEDDYDAVYTLTEEGRKHLNQIMGGEKE